jgi:hypothetical protein
MFARASIIDGILAGAGAGAEDWLLAPRDAIIVAGGLPGGVVEAMGKRSEMLDETVENADVTAMVDILGGALSLSLKDASKLGGKVWPFSQMSMSFFIFSYTFKRHL